MVITLNGLAMSKIKINEEKIAINLNKIYLNGKSLDI